MKHNKDEGTSVGFSKSEVFEIRKQCKHGFAVKKRVNDISIDGEVFRQVVCEICGKYRYKIDLSKYHPSLLNEIIFMNRVCTEHEWGAEWTNESIRDMRIICSKCGAIYHSSLICYMQVLCENDEHDFGEITWTTSGLNWDTKPYSGVRCRKCGQKSPIDFKIKENLEVINKQEWEEIFDKWNDTIEHEDREDWEFYKWLELNYLAPIKKK